MKKILLFCMFMHGLYMNGLDQPKVVKIAVFCSGNNNIAPDLKIAAYGLGQYLGLHCFGLITGGGSLGLMKEVADGYVSRAISLKEFRSVILQSHMPDGHPAMSKENIICVKSLHDRMDYFYDTADAFIVLPGGLGTLHELIDCLTHNKHMRKPIILLNGDGSWNNLIQQFQAIVTSNPDADQYFTSLVVVNTLSECIKFLHTHCYCTSISAMIGK